MRVHMEDDNLLQAVTALTPVAVFGWWILNSLQFSVRCHTVEFLGVKGEFSLLLLIICFKEAAAHMVLCAFKEHLMRSSKFRLC